MRSVSNASTVVHASSYCMALLVLHLGGTAALADAMYRSGLSPWSLDFFQVRHCTEKQTSFSDYHSHDCISALARISQARMCTTVCDNFVRAMCCFCFVALHLSNWQVTAVPLFFVISAGVLDLRASWVIFENYANSSCKCFGKGGVACRCLCFTHGAAYVVFLGHARCAALCCT